MNILYIDIETTGLDSVKHQILALSAIWTDGSKPTPIRERPCYKVLVNHATIIGESYALAMNAHILRTLAKAKNPMAAEVVGGQQIMPQWALGENFFKWLYETVAGPADIVVGGKNVAGFDIPFLMKAGKFTTDRYNGVSYTYKPHSTNERQEHYFKFIHRTMDPAPLWARYDDKKPPALGECCARALAWLCSVQTGLDEPQYRDYIDWLSLDVAHTAYEDAAQTAACVEVGMLRSNGTFTSLPVDPAT